LAYKLAHDPADTKEEKHACWPASAEIGNQVSPRWRSCSIVLHSWSNCQIVRFNQTSSPLFAGANFVGFCHKKSSRRIALLSIDNHRIECSEKKTNKNQLHQP
jgi:hypothetical protein